MVIWSQLSVVMIYRSPLPPMKQLALPDSAVNFNPLINVVYGLSPKPYYKR